MAYVLVTIWPSVYTLIRGDREEEMDDDNLIKSGINRESTFTHDVSQLEVLSLVCIFCLSVFLSDAYIYFLFLTRELYFTNNEACLDGANPVGQT